jgi:hypothetical protein
MKRTLIGIVAVITLTIVAGPRSHRDRHFPEQGSCVRATFGQPPRL